MSELKTKAAKASVDKFLRSIKDEQMRADCIRIAELMQKVTKAEPKMWGASIVGFGDYHYKYASGREGDWFLSGFSPRKQAITLYLMSGFDEFADPLAKLGKYSTGKGCLYLKRLADGDIKVLKELIARSVKKMKAAAA